MGTCLQLALKRAKQNPAEGWRGVWSSGERGPRSDRQTARAPAQFSPLCQVFETFYDKLAGKRMYILKGGWNSTSPS